MDVDSSISFQPQQALYNSELTKRACAAEGPFVICMDIHTMDSSQLQQELYSISLAIHTSISESVVVFRMHVDSTPFKPQQAFSNVDAILGGSL